MKNKINSTSRKTAAIFLITVFIAIFSVSCSKTDNNQRFSVIEISAPGCDPCINSEASFSALKTEFGKKIKFINYDVNSPEGQLIARTHALKVIPTLLVVNDTGIELFRHEGVFSEEQISPVLRNISRP